jgi:hypothetical protein
MIATLNNSCNYLFSFSALSALSAVKKLVQKPKIIAMSILLDLCRIFFFNEPQRAQSTQRKRIMRKRGV